MRSRFGICLTAIVLAAACGQTDAAITTSVTSRLAADKVVRARQIDVDTRDGVVTPRGEVKSPHEEARPPAPPPSPEPGPTNPIPPSEPVERPRARATAF